MNTFHRSKADTRWFLGVRCENCDFPILFALDHSEGVEGHRPPPADKLVLTCTLESCRHRADYTGAGILRLQKSPIEESEARKARVQGRNRN